MAITIPIINKKFKAFPNSKILSIKNTPNPTAINNPCLVFPRIKAKVKKIVGINNIKNGK